MGEYEVTTEHEVTDEDGETVTTVLRLNIATRAEMFHCWQVALKLHGTRIDGIDFEPKYPACDGSVGRGWHRHQWNPSQDSAERYKVPLTTMENIRSREDFLIRVFSTMRISLNSVDDGDGFLPFS